MAGTMQKRGNNKWQFEVACGTDASGKRIRYYKTFTGTKREANKALAEFITECERGNVQKSSSLLLNDLIKIYLDEYVSRELKTSAKSAVNSHIKTWINPLLGNKKISKLTRLDIQKFINHISDSKSPKTVRNVYSTLRGIFNYAIELDLISDTPCKNIRLPKKQKSEPKFYNFEEINILLQALDKLTGEEFKYKIVIQIALFGGLRKAEILGLNWEDINFENQVIKIQRNRLVAVHQGVYEDTPKTEDSERTVSLPAEVFNNLKKLKAYQAEQRLSKTYYKNSPAVIRNEIGEPLYPQVLQRWFKRFCDHNNIKYLGLHSLRHTHASILASMQDLDLASISKRLGHSQISTTLNIYTHLFKNKEEEISNNLSKQFNIN